MALYVGTNYHPHDWEPERWAKDIALMKEAGFQVVRLGHLCWDSFEPEDGRFEFEWFDSVMDAFGEAGIKVFLDMAVRPAPVWVHRLCPGCDIFSRGGNRQAALRRYMEDVDDPEYQYYALRFAETLVRRYGKHPALMGFGLCNEQGDGPVSFSPAAEKRFQVWLHKRYGSIEVLNRKWNTQRWSRRLQDFSDVRLQENELAVGAPEAFLDMRRFFGDGVLSFMKKLEQVVEREAPGVMHSSNHVAESDFLGFDYLKGCRDFVDYPGFGFYPNLDPADENTMMHVLLYLQHRLAELGRPMWCLEFQTGNFGCYAGQEGVIRMYAMLCLIYRTQMVLAWTWRSMLGGEEQYYFGLLDHDGACGRKYDEFARIASDFKKLEKYSLPYLPQPETAVAYCYENIPIYQYAKHFYRTPYKQQAADTVKVFFRRNLDINIVDLRNMEGDYKLLVIPGHALMTEAMAERLKSFTARGGIVIMTAYSAKVNDNNTVFDTQMPGLLSDMFGIRVGEFERTCINAAKEPEKTPRRRLNIVGRDGSGVCCEVSYWERIELQSADAYAWYGEEGKECAISVNSWGKGKAFYVSPETSFEVLGWLYDRLAEEEGLRSKISGPEGVVIRRLSDRETLFVNTTAECKEIALQGEAKAVLADRMIRDRLVLPPFDGELLSGGSV